MPDDLKQNSDKELILPSVCRRIHFLSNCRNFRRKSQPFFAGQQCWILSGRCWGHAHYASNLFRLAGMYLMYICGARYNSSSFSMLSTFKKYRCLQRYHLFFSKTLPMLQTRPILCTFRRVVRYTCMTRCVGCRYPSCWLSHSCALLRHCGWRSAILSQCLWLSLWWSWVLALCECVVHTWL